MDKHGFIRFATDDFFKSRVERFEKMFSFNGTMPNWYPSKNNPDWEKYPYKKFMGKYTTPYTECPAGVFCYRYFNMWMKFVRENRWMRFSYTDKRSHTRATKTLWVMRIDWKNGQYHQQLSIEGITCDGEHDGIMIDMDWLMDLCVHVCTKDESKRLTDMLNESQPEPYIQLFKVYRGIYSQDYDLYLSDCETWNIKPMPKYMIERAVEDFFIDVKSGCMTGISDDCYVVNVFPTNK